MVMASDGILGMIKGLMDRWLDRPTHSGSSDQLAALEELLAHHTVELQAGNINELVRGLKQKHVVDAICISQPNGSLIASSSENGVSESITASALFNYVQSEIPNSETVLVKSKDWNMLFKHNGRIFVVKAPASLTTIELKAISREVEEFLSAKHKKEKEPQKKAEKEKTAAKIKRKAQSKK